MHPELPVSAVNTLLSRSQLDIHVGHIKHSLSALGYQRLAFDSLLPVSPLLILPLSGDARYPHPAQVGFPKEIAQPKKSGSESLAAIEERELEGYGTDTPPLQPGSPAPHRPRPPPSAFEPAHEPQGSVLVDGLPLAEPPASPPAEPTAAEAPVMSHTFGRASVVPQRNLR